MKFKSTNMNKVLNGLVAITWLVFIGFVFAETDSDWESGFTGTETFWGAETNGIKVALFIEPIVSSNNVPIHCTPVIKSSIKGSNNLNTVRVYFPPLESCYQMTLRDEKGSLIPKTAKGKSLGKTITEPLMVKIGGLNMRAGYRMRPLIQNHSEVLSDFSFNLQDYFEVTNSGKYQLTYEMRIILPQSGKENFMAFYTTNLPTTILPSVIVNVEIKPPAGL
jgi:hypothetical protein